ncbi:hypothetical protein [Nocardia jiangxiensis]|uniref:Excreted virulence factor EspC, type VII ESX diderm n=1 Tax=Nocardia jiangxiensis TaxID=282685 RepID=A0ABW6RYE8_9NOCA|nr:hypothetical protein [Nocardia jiangxiensis]
MGDADAGVSTAKSLYQQAASGTFTMEEGVARKCAEAYQRLVTNTIDPQLEAAKVLHDLDGFGTFASAQQLKSGFEGKAASLVTVLESAKEAALEMAAAHLLAAKQIQEADEMHKQAIKVATEGVGK